MAFYNEYSPLSNFYTAPFSIDGVRYCHVEQYYTARKAETAQKHDLLEQVLKEKSPYKCKAIARQITNPKEWKRIQEDVMTTGCRAKFEQNDELSDFLSETGNKTIVEARADDKFWGAGLRHDDKQILSNKWPGKNRLGKILMSIRDNK